MNKKDYKIIITGDFCPVNRVEELIRYKNYELIFNDLLPALKQCDLAVTNLECPLTNSKTQIGKIGPSMKASIQSAEALSACGFKLVTLANNHIMDYGTSGLTSTIEACRNQEVEFVGAGLNIREARKVFKTRLGSLVISILNFAENEFSTTHDNSPGANPLNPFNNYRDIAEAKDKSDYLFVIVHGGHEMYNLPSPRMKDTFHFYADAGASAIFVHHAHCYSGYEEYRGVPIFYGLGNFVFDIEGKHNSIWNSGYMVELIINDSLDFNIIPYIQCDDQPGVRLMNIDERANFENDIGHLNSVILNDELLVAEFKKYCASVKVMYSAFLEPHSSRFLHILQKMKLFPSLLSKRKRYLYLNLMRCESHSDVVIDLLEKGDKLTPY